MSVEKNRGLQSAADGGCVCVCVNKIKSLVSLNASTKIIPCSDQERKKVLSLFKIFVPLSFYYYFFNEDSTNYHFNIKY